MSTDNQGARPVAVHLNCPHCHNPIELVTEIPDNEVICPSCGSSFKLDPDRTQSWSKDKLPTLGKFVLIEAVGRGAFGTVYRARDTELRRTVAVKVPRSGQLSTDEDEDRFVREARNAAQLHHPSIVPVHEVGRSDTFPYIVSEFVEGLTLSDALTGRGFHFREAAELVTQVAEALEHAHGQGVVHRDLKPSNIMLTPDGTPRVMDFGLAKRDAGEITVTLEGQVLGTPAYMSPEQASGQAHHVDGRSDVYSLGVILFELLTGELPFRGNQRMLLHQVLHDEPRAPRTLNDRIARDLETITLKAMAKEPSRRYQRAKELADDLRRWLKGEPIQARPVGRLERGWRWCRRNPLVASLSAGMALVLLMGTTVSTYFAIQANRRALEAVQQRQIALESAQSAVQERKRALASAQSALASADAERKAKETAQTRERETAAALSFVSDRVFAAARPEGQGGGLGREVTLRRAIESSLPFVKEAFANQPLVEAKLRWTLGVSYRFLGEPKIALEQYERARALYSQHLGPDHPDTLANMHNVALAWLVLGRHQEALKLLEETLTLRKAKLGPDHPDTLWSMNNLAVTYYALGRHQEALKLREETLALRKAKLGPDHPDTLNGMGNLAASYSALGRHQEALKLREETLALWKAKLGPDHPDTLRSMNDLAESYSSLGRHQAALKLREETLALQKAKLGPDHPDTLASMNDLANSYATLGRHPRALRLRKETLALRKAKLGPDHPETLWSMNNLAVSYHGLGRHQQALKLREETLALRKAKLGPVHPDTLNGMGNLATSYSALGRHQEALKLREETLALRKAKFGSVHPDTLASMKELANSYATLGRHQEALKLREETLVLRKAKLDPDHPDTLRSMNDLAGSYYAVGRHQEALKLREDTLALQKAKLGPDHPDTLLSMVGLGDLLAASGKWADGAALFAMVAGKKGDEAGRFQARALYGLAAARLMLGDQAGYHAACKELLDRYGAKAVGFRAYHLAIACVVGEHAVDDTEAVVAVARRAGRQNPVFPMALGVAQFRAGHIRDAMATIKAVLPAHLLALTVAPQMADNIHCSQLLGEVSLAMCYQDLRDNTALASQTKKVRSLLKKLEESPRKYNPSLEPWTVPFAIELAKRELPKLTPKGQPATK